MIVGDQLLVIHCLCVKITHVFSVILRSLDDDHTLNIPSALIFRCDSLVSLHLGDRLYYVINRNKLEINLPNLKKLVLGLDNSNWKEDTSKHFFKRLFKSCPLLEELRLKTEFSVLGYVDAVEIVCPNLKTLHLDAKADGVTVVVKINAPELESLSVITHRACFSIVSQLTRLERVEFGIWNDMSSDPELKFWDYVSDAFIGISSVRVFELNGGGLDEMYDMEDGLPVYQNLAEVRITDFAFTKLADLFRLLKYCPNLEVLVLTMDGEHDDVERNSYCEVPEFEPVCLFTKLRVLELKNLCGREYSLHFMQYMLGSESVLEKLVVGVASDYEGREAKDNEEELCHELFSYLRYSSALEISFSGQRITATSKNSVVVDEDSES